MVRWDYQYTTKGGIISMYMKHETPAGEKWRMACLSCIWVGCRQAGALRKHPNSVRWYYHAPVIQDLPPHVPWPRNSFLIGNTQKLVAEHINVFFGWKKNPKNADKSWNEWKRDGKQHTIRTESNLLDVTTTTARPASLLYSSQGGFQSALWQDCGYLIDVKRKEQWQIHQKSSKSKFQGKEMKSDWKQT